MGIQLLKDKKKREKFGKELREIIEENYRWEDIIMEYEKVYLKVKKT